VATLADDQATFTARTSLLTCSSSSSLTHIPASHRTLCNHTRIQNNAHEGELTVLLPDRSSVHHVLTFKVHNHFYYYYGSPIFSANFKKKHYEGQVTSTIIAPNSAFTANITSLRFHYTSIIYE
jgi:hypothetical protein